MKYQALFVQCRLAATATAYYSPVLLDDDDDWQLLIKESWQYCWCVERRRRRLCSLAPSEHFYGMATSLSRSCDCVVWLVQLVLIRSVFIFITKSSCRVVIWRSARIKCVDSIHIDGPRGWTLRGFHVSYWPLVKGYYLIESQAKNLVKFYPFIPADP